MLVDAGGGVEVEVRQRRRCGQGGEPEPAGELAGFGRLDLAGQQVLQGRGHRPPLFLGFGEHAGQVLGRGGQLQRREVPTQLLVEAGLAPCHR